MNNELIELEAKTKAEVIIANTEYGKNVIYSVTKPSDYGVINKWFRNGQLTEQFLNAKTISDLISEEQMKDKDFMRIAGILKKSEEHHYNSATKSALLSRLNIWKAKNLASQMGAKIKNEEKRQRRKEIAKNIGANFIAVCF